jgi:hypothetical protein
MNNNGDNDNTWPAWGLDEEGSMEDLLVLGRGGGGGDRRSGQSRPLPL